MVVDWGGCIVSGQHLILVCANAKTFPSVQILLHARISKPQYQANFADDKKTTVTAKRLKI